MVPTLYIVLAQMLGAVRHSGAKRIQFFLVASVAALTNRFTWSVIVPRACPGLGEILLTSQCLLLSLFLNKLLQKPLRQLLKKAWEAVFKDVLNIWCELFGISLALFRSGRSA